VTDEETLSFVYAVVKSVWALELLLLLRRQNEQSWKLDELVHELRASRKAVQIGLEGLRASGLVTFDSEDAIRYCPVSDQLDELVASIQQLYLTKPVAVISAIATPIEDQLRLFAESFRLKE
jgi:hypothetical protein